MAMKKCLGCGEQVEDKALFMSDRGEICGACQLDEDDRDRSSFQGLNPLVIIGVVAAIIPFFINIRSESTTSLSGGGISVSQSIARDYIALGGGFVALLVGALLLVLAIKGKVAGRKNLAAMVVILLLGSVQLLRGYGIL